MTTVVFTKNSAGEYLDMTCMGHTGYAKKGTPDILCSAISALTIHTANGISQVVGDEFDFSQNEETGFFRCVFKTPLKEGSKVLLDSLVQSLDAMSAEYGDAYLQVSIKQQD